MSISPETETKILSKLEQIDERLKNLEIGQARIEEKLNGVDKRLDDTNGRLIQIEGRVNTQANWFLAIFGVLVAGLLTVVGKLGFFPNQP